MTFPSKNPGQCHMSLLKLVKECTWVFCSFILLFVGNGGEGNCCCMELKVQVRFTPVSTFFFMFPEFKKKLCVGRKWE